nr:endonuclease [Bacilli bacterium]
MKKSRLIIISKTLMITLVTLILVMGAYVAYVSIQYHRLDDELVLNVHNNNSQIVDVNNEYVIMTYNIGFGAYNHDFSFFMDTGEMLSGEKMKGTKAKAEDKRVVENNTNGAIELVKTVEPDFLFLQEVDVAANRSYFVDQYALFSQA